MLSHLNTWLGLPAGYHVPPHVQLKKAYKISRVVDPDQDWIRIQRLCGYGSVLGIRIQGQENLRNFSGKNALFSYLNKKFTTEKV
jgi:hypothetical protein